LLVRFEMGSLLIHLGMSGSLRILTHPHTQPLKKHDHVQLFFERGIEVRYHDPRRFGLLLWAEQHQHPLLNKIGLEPLSEEFSLPWLTQLCQKRTTPIKPLLMTSHLITGVGNIYANESLFCAGIHPTSPAMSLTSDQVNRLHRCIQETLSRAIAQGGSTLRDFVNTEGQPGYFAQTLQVYGRAGQACHRCSTPIEKLIQAQRTSFFCPICQTSSPVNTTQHPSTKGQTS
jgi:formamidopyrimidine-DNA glycosylase